jgi:hypothetical protein
VVETPYMLGKCLFCAALVTVLVCGAFTFGQENGKTPTQQLYLLAATPIDIGSRGGYPATLYSVQAGKLKIAREVLSGSEGAASVTAWGNMIFLTHPLYRGDPKAVSIIHTNDPMRPDDVVFSPEARSMENLNGFTVIKPLVAISEDETGAIDVILPIETGNSLQRGAAPTFVAVAGELNAAASRVKQNAWAEYVRLRRDGDAGGPFSVQNFPGVLSGDSLVLPPVVGHTVILDHLPPSVLAAAEATALHQFVIIAARQQYLILQCHYSGQEFTSGKVGRSVDMFVHDRLRDRWETIQIEGNLSRSRLFGSWVATVVEMVNAQQKPRPGTGNERSVEKPGLPSVSALYASVTGWRPGVLVLENIEDGRKIRIETDEEDSEVLSVQGDEVFYRVNDAIYQARIAGNELQKPSVLVKEEDVPEIHWVFWGP